MSIISGGSAAAAMGGGTAATILAVFGVLMVVLFIALIIEAVKYVFQSLAMYTIAKRRKIKNYGLAWVPIVNTWILGSVSDQYDYITTQKRKNSRYLLLALRIAVCVLTMILSIFAGVMTAVATYETAACYDSYYQGYYGSDVGSASSSVGSTAAILLFILVIAAIAIVYLVFYYISLYKIFKSCAPENAVAFLVLSIFFPITTPFFLFAIRNKDIGVVNAVRQGQGQDNAANGAQQIPAEQPTATAAPEPAAPAQTPTAEAPAAANYNPYARQTAEAPQTAVNPAEPQNVQQNTTDNNQQ